MLPSFYKCASITVLILFQYCYPTAEIDVQAQVGAVGVSVTSYSKDKCDSNSYSCKTQFCCCTDGITKFRSEQIVPDVIHTLPTCGLRVKFDSGVEAHFGNEITPTQAMNQPKVEWVAEKYALYTLALVDPDALSRDNPIYREFLHWLVVNIRGNNVASGLSLADYFNPSPPNGTGIHRYTCLMFKQAKMLKPDEQRLTNKTTDSRPNFKIANFSEKYNLGPPLYGNFFVAKWDPYVSVVESQLDG